MHPQQFSLARIEFLEPFCWEIVVWIQLKHQYRFAIVGEDSAAKLLSAVGAAGVPALPVKDPYAACLARRLIGVFYLKAFGWAGITASN